MAHVKTDQSPLLHFLYNYVMFGKLNMEEIIFLNKPFTIIESHINQQIISKLQFSPIGY